MVATQNVRKKKNIRIYMAQTFGHGLEKKKKNLFS